MSTGPWHYTEAERCLEAATREVRGSDAERYYLDAASIHAQLASAAAFAIGTKHMMTDPNRLAWRAVAGEIGAE